MTDSQNFWAIGPVPKIKALLGLGNDEARLFDTREQAERLLADLIECEPRAVKGCKVWPVTLVVYGEEQE